MKQKKNSNTLVYYKVIYSCEYSIKLILKCYVKNCLSSHLFIFHETQIKFLFSNLILFYKVTLK